MNDGRIGPHYFDGRLRRISDRIPRSALNVRAVEGVRPLAVGAPYSQQFEALAPLQWSPAIVLAQLFKCFDMERGGWDRDHMTLDDLGAGDTSRRWLVTKL